MTVRLRVDQKLFFVETECAVIILERRDLFLLDHEILVLM